MSDAPIQLRLIVDREGCDTTYSLQMRHRPITGVGLIPYPGRVEYGSWSEWEKVPEFDFLGAYEADEEERRERRLKEILGD